MMFTQFVYNVQVTNGHEILFTQYDYNDLVKINQFKEKFVFRLDFTRVYSMFRMAFMTTIIEANN